jgi:Serine phosphatase RsbU, regulator of sigma subunit
MLPGCAPVPMWLRGRAIGVLVAIRAPQEPLAEIARQGTAALELAGVYTDVFEIARRRRKTSPAAEIQLNLLPPRNARVAGAEFAGSLLPSYDVGGDWFDFVENRDGAWLAIADAYGRGPEAAALGSIVLGALRAARRTGAGLEQAARDMDRVVHEIGHADFFATGIVAHWHAPSGILRWVTCAHPPPLVAAPGGTLEELATGGHPAFGRAGRRQEFRADERSLRGASASSSTRTGSRSAAPRPEASSAWKASSARSKGPGHLPPRPRERSNGPLRTPRRTRSRTTPPSSPWPSPDALTERRQAASSGHDARRSGRGLRAVSTASASSPCGVMLKWRTSTTAIGAPGSSASGPSESMISLPVWKVSTQATCQVRSSMWRPIRARPVCSVPSMRVA